MGLAWPGGVPQPELYNTSHHPPNQSNHTIGPGHQDFQTQLVLQTQTSTLPSGSVIYTRSNGQAYAQPTATQRVGEDGPVLLQDIHLIENLASLVRERIPERVVHAKGAGAHGVFTVTTDFAKNHTMMDLFSEIGKKTPISVRFSTIAGESGSSDQERDPSLNTRFRTGKGIWDLVMNNSPVFFLRDPALFPLFTHTQKRNPQTHLKDPNMYWDYLGSHPESLYEFVRVFTDLGTPDGFVNMDAWAGHSYRWVKADGTWVYVKIVAISQQGVHNLTASAATHISGTNPDYATQDLYQRIDQGQFPSWKLLAQVLTPAEAEKFKYNVLDVTKEWPVDMVPPHEIGEFVLNQNPENYFAEIEQLAFSPSNLVDGWEPSADPVLQARLFAYPDAQRYRLGTNFNQIPINCPMNPVANFQRDGQASYLGNQGSRANYLSSFQSINLPPSPYDVSNHTAWVGGAVRSMSQVCHFMTCF
ncbi:uncharacterized protein MELLADRAFT_38712 [Melampsora larici-populina 98AG31]|uniref:Catalase core domain-containing protein n=1 Tax=Melampsora larici-populina (strain 98AG31 / pathotype 3-4-7) TaxID=747676 RepID=F4RZE4_MELLP|nr:uncharacterized protein MELLADRAFT_38712 [Melampsora larici-populina 98AG31]EGG02269.1 hypothetical protein MELLADRAFT_38712 [Melampsora larici-populina 98AG31]